MKWKRNRRGDDIIINKYTHTHIIHIIIIIILYYIINVYQLSIVNNKLYYL